MTRRRPHHLRRRRSGDALPRDSAPGGVELSPESLAGWAASSGGLRSAAAGLAILGLLGVVVNIRLSLPDEDEITAVPTKVSKQLDAVGKQLDAVAAQSALVRDELGAVRREVRELGDGLADYGARVERLERAREDRDREIELRRIVDEELRRAAERGRDQAWDRAMEGFQAEREAWDARQRARRQER